jgi:hypothetical protein
MYYLYMERRIRMEDKRVELEQECLYLFPERWKQIHLADYYPTDSYGSTYDEVPVNDIDEIDQFMEQLGQIKTMSGADIDEDRWRV